MQQSYVHQWPQEGREVRLSARGFHQVQYFYWTYLQNLLSHATKGGNVAIIETMLSRGFDINSKDIDGDTPLMKAAWCDKMEAVHYLLDKGADTSLKGQ